MNVLSYLIFAGVSFIAVICAGAVSLLCRHGAGGSPRLDRTDHAWVWGTAVVVSLILAHTGGLNFFIAAVIGSAAGLSAFYRICRGQRR